MTQFYGKTKICYGNDALDSLDQLPATKAFIVTDPFMVKTGFIDRIKSHLDRCGIAHHTFDKVEPDPSLEIVMQGTVQFLKNQADLLIALGGGSSIDTAKAIKFFASKASEKRVKPLLVAIPTTSGTGSEVTAIAVVTDKVSEVKIPLDDEFLIPDYAVLDARFTRTLPPHVTAATGMDVLTHGIEAYVSRQANIFTSIYARHAIRYVFKNLQRAYRCKDDMEARDMMLLGSCMAGMAFNNSGLGITHSMAHALGAHFHVPHGLANAVLLPYVIEFNSFDVGVQYGEISTLLSLPASSVDEGTASLTQAIRDLNSSMEIPNQIRSLKLDEKSFRESLDAMASSALRDICTQGNPRRPSHEDIRGLLEQAW